jgi:hypothetical protein
VTLFTLSVGGGWYRGMRPIERMQFRQTGVTMVALMIENSKLIMIFLLMATVIVLSHFGNAASQRGTRD